MIVSSRKQVQEIAGRMRGICSMLRTYVSKSEQRVSLELVEKWAREIEAVLEREGD